ncbi:MAG TPA: alpha-1,4-glucan--maltose-1-phosphate maltosyltransferase [Ilumatobacteraceae bacterium]|nr:alpha-1,4-glucan--maltose-1-phosphate maltosyltransferase [Ilumatobacteraceae bacterium]
MTTSQLPPERPSRVVVEAVRPVVDAGRFPTKATIDEPLRIEADVFADGHDVVDAVVRWRPVAGTESTAGTTGDWREMPMTPLGNDRFGAWVVLDRLGRWEYDVMGWVDHLESWRRGVVKKVGAGLDVHVELLSGARLLAAVLDRGVTVGDDTSLGDHRLIDGLRRRLLDGDASTLDDDRWTAVFARCSLRSPAGRFDHPLRVDVDPLHGAFGAWYEFFPRSSVDARTPPPRTLRDSIGRLDHIASMGFDVIYLPPVHPIGLTKRKGRNGATTPGPDDVGSPWAIGSGAGGHTAVAPELGTVDDVTAFADACRQRGMRLALDIAFQCSPDHPWVTEHPEWFARRADGTVQYAENPPKKYEDIYPLDFESDDWEGLWQALADVFRFWIERGVRTFRVDNPHTKAFAFWEWALGEIRRDHPDTVFLAEAFTRPRVMERLAKIGFNQSYTYFAWRQSAWELRDYFADLAGRTVDVFRPNAWPNTPDILTEQLQTGGRPAFVTRAVLAATLSPSWGVYGPAYELLEHRAVREGSEEYLDSEKFQTRTWDLDRDDSLAPLLARLNRIRADHRAFRRLDTLRFHQTDDPGLLCYSKTDPAGHGRPVIVVVNLDPFARHAGYVDIDLAAIDLPYGCDYDVVDELGGVTHRWSGNRNFVDLAPWSASAHVFSVRTVGDTTDTATGAGG